MKWRAVATRLHGDGTESLIAPDLPLTKLRVARAVSGPGGVSGTIPLEVARLIAADGRPVLTPWAAAVYVEKGQGLIVGAGLVSDESVSRQGQQLQLTTAGFTSYPHGVPYVGESSWVDADPAGLVRHAWDHVQGFPGGDLGMVVDQMVTPVRVGTPERDVSFTTGEGEDVSFVSGPYQWNSWSTQDLGAEIDKLAQDTPLDFVESHAWDGEQVAHHLRLGHPRIGTRRHDLRFVVGENIIEDPQVQTGPWASEITVLGAGEGRTMRRGHAAVGRTGRLRRPLVLVDKSLQSPKACESAAAVELGRRSGTDKISTITVMDHPSAPLASWSPGDEILIQGSGRGWAGDLYQWVRVLSDDISIDDARATLTVEGV